ncbi:L-fucose-proton symporter, partial [termite gut metagenome]
NQLIQVGATFNSLAGTTVPMLVGALVGNAAKARITDVFPVMYIAMGVFAFIFIVLALVQIPEPHATVKKASSTQKDKYSAWSFRHFVLGAIGIFVYVGVEVGIPGTMNLFLADPDAGGLAATTAGFVVGTYWFLMLVGRFVGTGIASKVSSRSMLAVVSGVGLILVVAAILSPVAVKVSIPVLQSDYSGISFGLTLVPISAMFLVLAGLCTSIMWGGIFNLAVEGLGKYIAMASGIFMMLVCGGGILPFVQNAIADAAGYLTSYWVVFVGLAYLLYYALIGSKNVNKDIPVD